jgi:hypothetical protein
MSSHYALRNDGRLPCKSCGRVHRFISRELGEDCSAPIVGSRETLARFASALDSASLVRVEMPAPPEPVYIVANGHDQAFGAAEDLGLDFRDRRQVRVIDTHDRPRLEGVWLLERQVHYAEGAGLGRHWPQVDAAIQRSIERHPSRITV